MQKSATTRLDDERGVREAARARRVRHAVDRDLAAAVARVDDHAAGAHAEREDGAVLRLVAVPCGRGRATAVTGVYRGGSGGSGTGVAVRRAIAQMEERTESNRSGRVGETPPQHTTARDDDDEAVCKSRKHHRELDAAAACDDRAGTAAATADHT